MLGNKHFWLRIINLLVCYAIMVFSRSWKCQLGNAKLPARDKPISMVVEDFSDIYEKLSNCSAFQFSCKLKQTSATFLLCVLLAEISYVLCILNKYQAIVNQEGVLVRRLHKFSTPGSLTKLDYLRFLIASKCNTKSHNLNYHFNTIPGALRECCVYPVFDMLVSFLPLTQNGRYNCQYSFTELVEAGFKYTGERDVVKCTGCCNTVELSNFTTDPRSSVYHTAGCEFTKRCENMNGSRSLQGRDCMRDSEAASISCTAELSLHLASSCLPTTEGGAATVNRLEDGQVRMRQASSEHLGTSTVHTAAQQFSDPQPFRRGTPTRGSTTSGYTSGYTSGLSSGYATDPHTFDGCTNPELTTGATPAQTQTGDVPYGASAASLPGDNISSAVSGGARSKKKKQRPATTANTEPIQRVLFDEELVTPETLDKKEKSRQFYEMKCLKNGNHRQYFPARNLRIEHLPASIRCPEVLRIIELMSYLTVKITVKGLSPMRSSREGKGRKCQIGTGSCLEYPCTELKADDRLTRRFPFRNQEKIWQIYVEVNSSIVFDNLEAENTIVKFDRGREKTTARGNVVQHSDISGDQKSRLICYTNDPELVNTLDKCREGYWRLLRHLPSNIQEGFLNKVLIVGYPHGHEKFLSYGSCGVINYNLTTCDTQSGTTFSGMQAISNIPHMIHSDTEIRKVLHYDASTCPGSCGSPILTFKRSTHHDGTVGMEPELWMHNGTYDPHGRNGSVIKRLTSDDVGHQRRSAAALEAAVADENEVDLELAHLRTITPEARRTYVDSLTAPERPRAVQGGFPVIYRQVSSPEPRSPAHLPDDSIS